MNKTRSSNSSFPQGLGKRFVRIGQTMFRFISLVSCFIVLIPGVMLAQQEAKLERIPNVIPPSPNAASLGKFGEIPVGLYTGTPNISIPLHNISVGEFSLPISLSYHASGVKVEEFAPSVGLGWALLSGGVISVSPKGLIDEEASGYLEFGGQAGKMVGKYFQGKMTSAEKQNYLVALSRGDYDSEPDLYSFNFGGWSGRFMIDTNNVSIPIPYQDIRIKKDNGNFIVTDTKGNIYFFEDKEITQAIPKSRKDNAMSSYLDPKVYTSSWYLSRITLYNGVEIRFNYTTATISPTYRVAEARYMVQQNEMDCDGNLAFEPTHSYETWTETQIQQKKIKSVTFPNGIVEFNYDATQRLDMPGDHALREVIVYTKNESGNKVKLNHYNLSFIYGSNRLFLQTITEMGKDSSANPKQYAFFYNNIGSLPATTSKGIDYWGYYNGEHRNNTLIPTSFQQEPYFPNGANRSVNPAVLKYGTLEKIVYPTGGFTVFGFEPHQYGFAQGRGDIMEAETKETTVDKFLNGEPTAQETRLMFPISHTQEVTVESNLSGYQTYAMIVGADNQVYYVHNAPRSSTVDTKQRRITLQGGKAYYLVTFNYEEEFTCNIGVSYKERYATGEIKKNLLAGGLRIKSINNYDRGGGRLSSKQFEYNSQNEPDRSSGILVSQFYNEHVKPVKKVVVCGAEEHPSGSIGEEYNGSYLVRLSYSSLPPALSQGSHVVYSQVLVKDSSETSSNGFTISSFLSPKDYSDVLFTTFPFAIGVSNDHLRGHLKQKTEYGLKDNTFYKVKSTTNKYVSLGDSLTGMPGLVVATLSENTLVSDFIFREHRYLLFTQRFNLVESVDTLFDASGNGFVSVQKRYHYDSPYHNLLTQETVSKSEGGEFRVEYSYPFESRMSPPAGSSQAFLTALDSLIATNRIDRVIEKTHYSDNSFLSGELTRYKNWVIGNRNLALPEIYEKRHFSDPYYVEAKIRAYDMYGNIAELSKNEENNVSYLWGYNGQLPTAEVKNAGINEVYLENFEDSSSSASGDAYTGNKYHLGDFSITWEKPINKEYIITYWYRDGGSWKSSMEPYSAPRILTLGDAIDDIRIYPKDAEVTTYTYDPLVGATSVTDPNGRTTFYEYDWLGRLKVVKDHEGNVVRSHEYHYAGH